MYRHPPLTTLLLYPWIELQSSPHLKSDRSIILSVISQPSNKRSIILQYLFTAPIRLQPPPICLISPRHQEYNYKESRKSAPEVGTPQQKASKYKKNGFTLKQHIFKIEYYLKLDFYRKIIDWYFHSLPIFVFWYFDIDIKAAGLMHLLEFVFFCLLPILISAPSSLIRYQFLPNNSNICTKHSDMNQSRNMPEKISSADCISVHHFFSGVQLLLLDRASSCN